MNIKLVPGDSKREEALSQAASILARPITCGYKSCRPYLYKGSWIYPAPIWKGLSPQEENEAIYLHCQKMGHK